MTARAIRDRREHDAFRLLAAAAIDGRIDADDAVALEAHLAGCPTCRADQQAMLEDHLWLATPARVAPPDPLIRQGIIEAARSYRVPKPSTSYRSTRPWAALIAASLVLAVGAILIGNTPRGPSVGAADSPGTPSVPASTGTEHGACAPLPAGLTAWWAGEGDARDSAGRHDGSTHGNVQFSPGLVGDAITLDGISAYVDVAHDPLLDVGARDFTIELWVRFLDLVGEPVLIEKWHDPAGGWPDQEGWTLQKSISGQLNLYAADGAERFGVGTDAVPFETGAWYHIAVRRAGPELSMLVNGVVIARSTRPEGPLDLAVDGPIMIGRRGDDAGDFLHGQLDEIRLFIGRALSDAEVLAVYRAGAAGICRA